MKNQIFKLPNISCQHEKRPSGYVSIYKKKNISGPVLRDKEVSFFFRNQGSSITSRGQVPGKFLSRKLQISISRFKLVFACTYSAVQRIQMTHCQRWGSRDPGNKVEVYYTGDRSPTLKIGGFTRWKHLVEYWSFSYRGNNLTWRSLTSSLDPERGNRRLGSIPPATAVFCTWCKGTR